MTNLLLRSWISLLYFDVILRFGGLLRVHDIVRNQKICSVHGTSGYSAEVICHAVDLACVFYFKEVLCLQRSAVTTVLLRRCGWGAEMVIGAQIRPFKSHAWVESGGLIVNDKPYMPEIYHELERC